MSTITASVAGGNWSAGGAWVGGVAPTAADDAVLTTGCGSITIDSATLCVCRSLNCTGYTNTLAFTGVLGPTLKIGDGTVGHITFSSGMTCTGTNTITFVSTTGSNTITTNGCVVPGLIFSGAGGSWIFADNVTLLSDRAISITNGTLNTNGKAVRSFGFQVSGASSSLTLGASIVTLTGGTGWSVTSAPTLSAASATIILDNTAAGSNHSFSSGASRSYNSIVAIGSGSGYLILDGSSSCNLLQTNHEIRFGAGTTQTVATFVAFGTPAANIVLRSQINGVAWNINGSINPSAIFAHRVTLQDSHAGGTGVTWTANKSTNTSGNTGWTFTDRLACNPPSKGAPHLSVVALDDMVIEGSKRIAPTLAAGDFLIDIDGGGFSALSVAPVVAPAGTCAVLLTMTADEMDGDLITIKGIDQTVPKEWADFMLCIPTTA